MYEPTLADLEARDPVADQARMRNRIEAFRDLQPSETTPLVISTPPKNKEFPPGLVPEIDAAELTVETLRSAMSEHGSLIVRNLFSSTTVDTLTLMADRVIDACAATPATGVASTYYSPPENLRSIMPNKERELVNTRTFHRDSGSAMCIEAPSVAETLLELYQAHGLKDLITAYLGEPPCLSVKKWVLRRSKLPVAEAGWHQDGAFMGTNLNSINMWLPLNACGGTTGAPGLDVVPQRLYQIASAEGAQFDWSVSDSLVSNRFADNKPVVPLFHAGDAYFFDHFFLHRTQYRTDFTKLRYAIETWFFGETRFAKNQIPLSW